MIRGPTREKGSKGDRSFKKKSQWSTSIRRLVRGTDIRSRWDDLCRNLRLVDLAGADANAVGHGLGSAESPVRWGRQQQQVQRALTKVKQFIWIRAGSRRSDT